jgi:hypothetical protein
MISRRHTCGQLLYPQIMRLLQIAARDSNLVTINSPPAAHPRNNSLPGATTRTTAVLTKITIF